MLTLGKHIKRTLTSSQNLAFYNKNGHFSSLHFDLMLDSHDNSKSRLDMLGRPFTRTKQPIIGQHSGEDNARVIKLIIKKPKKPNSANRKFAKIDMEHSDRIQHAKIRFENNNLVEHSLVKAFGKRTKDIRESSMTIRPNYRDCKYSNNKPKRIYVDWMNED